MNPAPRARVTAVNEIDWPISNTISTTAFSEPSIPFSVVMEGRRSRREMSAPRLSEVFGAIEFATRSRYVRSGRAASQYRRPSPSAGALHPLRVAVVPVARSPRIFLCDPDHQRVHGLRIARKEKVDEIKALRRELAASANGAIVVLIANERLTAAHYHNHEALLWRDAGALLQTLLLSFEAYSLRACALGINGQEVIDALALPNHARGAGIIVVGK